MAYERQTFVNQTETQKGTVLTAEHLMHIEDGIVANDKYHNLKNKKISIVGDSISTYAGWIPSGYKSFYTGTNCDIDNVNKTWWKQCIDTIGLELVVNASWHGSAVSKPITTNGVSNGGSKPACNSERVNALTKNGITPDIIIIYMGPNDLKEKVPVGDWDGGPLPESEQESYATFSEAYALLVANVMTKYPNAEVFCGTLLDLTAAKFDYEGGKYPSDVTDLNGQLLTIRDYNKAIMNVANSMGANLIDFHSCGLNYFNASNYYVDGAHPNAAGAKLLARKAVTELCAKSRYNQPLTDS